MADKETVIGVETRISGEIRGDEDLVIKGRVDGKIHLSQALTVDKGAIVQADVDVRTLVVAGILVGSIVASESVRLQPTARVVGNLASPRVMMEAGAAYRGRVDMGDVEAARAAVASRAVAKPAASGTDAAKARPAPPRVAAPPRTVAPTTKCAAFRCAVGRRSTGDRASVRAAGLSTRRGAANSAAPAWAREIRRR